VRFLADMNISPLTVSALHRDGYDVQRVSELLPPNASDAAILTYARRHKWSIITQDLDFSALLAVRGHAKPSVISVRTSSADPGLITSRLRLVLERYRHELARGCIISVDETGCRIRMLPID